MVAEMQGERSPIRFKSDQPLEFVVNLGSWTPEAVILYRFESKKGKRTTKMVRFNMLSLDLSSDMVKRPAMIETQIKRIGNAFKYSPTKPLPPGEYAFFPDRDFQADHGAKIATSMEAFCFEID